jgi:hypothetical protein
MNTVRSWPGYNISNIPAKGVADDGDATQGDGGAGKGTEKAA